MSIYVVVDTNVLVSAFITRNPDAATSKVWEAVMHRRLTPLYNEDIIKEYSEVLERPKFCIPQDITKKVINKIVSEGLRSERVLSHDSFPDPKDVVFYEVALSKEDAYLVTGNQRHFPKSPIVVTPAEMLQILEEKEGRG